MVAKAIMRFGKNVLGALSTKVSDVGAAALESILETPGYLASMLKSASEKLEPVDVIARCVPIGAGVDDYLIELDDGALMSAIAEGRWVRPHLIVRATSDQIDRDILATRLEVAFKELLNRAELRVDQKRKEEEQAKARDVVSQEAAGYSVLTEFAGELIIASLLGAGTLIAPVIYILIALGGFAVLSSVPGLVYGLFKQWFTNTPLEEEQEQINAARALIRKLVRTMRIEVLDMHREELRSLGFPSRVVDEAVHAQHEGLFDRAPSDALLRQVRERVKGLHKQGKP